MSKISNLLSKEKTISLEFFVPKTLAGQKKLYSDIKNIKDFIPSFSSVTYSVKKNSVSTDKIVKFITNNTNITAMPHLTCITHSKLEIDSIINKYNDSGIQNILALRGDIPKDMLELKEKDYHNALELVHYIRSKINCDIGVAIHPEGHPDASSKATDLSYQKEKIIASNFGITQFFFDENKYFTFVENLKKSNITTPIIAGLMPPANINSLISMSKLNGTELPKNIINGLNKLKNNKDCRKFAIESTVILAKKLLANDAPGIHIYTMNDVSLGIEIAKQLKD
jgi:methylenetetrahydrofolate reductase (NADPH)|tara:strand:+ start:4744 stop:5592 length:849 start_codon:yes stop_codon:yes gene_type:complete